MTAAAGPCRKAGKICPQSSLPSAALPAGTLLHSSLCKPLSKSNGVPDPEEDPELGVVLLPLPGTAQAFSSRLGLPALWAEQRNSSHSKHQVNAHKNTVKNST